jgi:hypothetical protein
MAQYEKQEAARFTNAFRYAAQDFQGFDGRDGKQIIGSVPVPMSQA